MLIALIIAISGDVLMFFMLRGAGEKSRAAKIEVERLELKLMAIEEEKKIIIQERFVIVERIVTNQSMVKSIGSNREKMEGDYASARTWADAVRVYRSHTN